MVQVSTRDGRTGDPITVDYWKADSFLLGDRGDLELRNGDGNTVAIVANGIWVAAEVITSGTSKKRK